MALPSVLEIVKKELPYLTSNDDVDISTSICLSQWELQVYLNKEDIDVETESSYTNRENILVGYFTAYNMICQKVLLNMEGNIETGTSTSNKVLKRAKADAVEAEFTVGKASDGTQLLMTAESIKNGLAKKTCQIAASLNITLPMCEELFPRDGVIVESFMFFPSDC